MSYLASQEITDLKSEFEGGASLSVDWYALLRRGGQKLLNNINPETLKRVVPIYGGLTRHLQVYYCPADVEVPSRLYSYDRTVKFDYMPSAQFWSTPYSKNRFTIEYVNGVRFVVVKHPMSLSSVTLDEMDDADDAEGDVTLSENTYNVLPGATASLQGTFTDAAYTIGRVLDVAVDISDLLRGVAIVPVYMDDKSKLASLKLRIYTDASNYYEVITTQDSIGDYLRDGQNMVRFWMNNATAHGTPDPANITEYKIFAPQETGESQTLIFGKLTVQKSNLFFLEYYSNYLFTDKTTGAWKDTPVAGDSVNLDRDARGILHYETARLVFQRAKVERTNAPERQSFDTELAREYNQYYLLHPSSAQPQSYSIMPNIPHVQDPYYDGVGYDLADSIGDNTDSQPETSVHFADSETPSPGIDGTTQTFTLAHTPDPASSVVVTLNGQILVLGQDYTVAANTITLLTPYYTAPFIGLSFLVSYRYNV
jgi:hypothetical protein